ncbi:MAG: DegV family protein [Anaerolineales bacterium]
MSTVAIVTDSTAYIPQNFLDEYQITVAPQVLIWGDQTYEDGVDIQPEEFYRRLKTAAVMPTTSQVTIPNFHKIFQNLLDQGKEILAILISTKLSGTIDSAIQAKGMLPGAPIEIVDSYTTAMAMGFQVLTVARAAKAGANLEECKRLAEEVRNHTGVVFAVDTLEFLHRGGRIGGGSRFLGTALNIKPLLEVTGGRVEAVERVRTRKKSLLRLAEIIEERTRGKSPIRLATLHANAAEEAQELLDELSRRLNPVETIFSTVSPVIGTHAGPGTVGIAYLTGM